MIPTRADAWKLLNEFTQSPSLIKHALAVEAAMRAYAAKFGEDVELWGATGLVHDFDYEQHPTADEHPRVGASILQDRGWPEEVVRAVQGHGTHLNVPRTTRMAQALFAVDELTGFVAACALVQPSKSIHDLQVRSVQKKWKDKAFARAVNRQEMESGARELGVQLEEHIEFVLGALKPVAAALGLLGAPGRGSAGT